MWKDQRLGLAITKDRTHPSEKHIRLRWDLANLASCLSREWPKSSLVWSLQSLTRISPCASFSLFIAHLSVACWSMLWGSARSAQADRCKGDHSCESDFRMWFLPCVSIIPFLVHFSVTDCFRLNRRARSAQAHRRSKDGDSQISSLGSMLRLLEKVSRVGVLHSSCLSCVCFILLTFKQCLLVVCCVYRESELYSLRGQLCVGFYFLCSQSASLGRMQSSYSMNSSYKWLVVCVFLNLRFAYALTRLQLMLREISTVSSSLQKFERISGFCVASATRIECFSTHERVRHRKNLILCLLHEFALVCLSKFNYQSLYARGVVVLSSKGVGEPYINLWDLYVFCAGGCHHAAFTVWGNSSATNEFDRWDPSFVG